MKFSSSAHSTPPPEAHSQLSQRKNRERTLFPTSGTSSSVSVPNQVQTPWHWPASDDDMLEDIDSSSFVNVGLDGSEHSDLDDATSPRGARSPVSPSAEGSSQGRLSPRSGSPASCASSTSSDSDSESASEASSSSGVSARLRSRSRSLSSAASWPPSPQASPAPSAPGERVLRESAEPSAASPATNHPVVSPASPSLKQSATLIGCGIGAAVVTMVAASHTKTWWQPPMMSLWRFGQQKAGEHLINPISESLSQGSRWLARFGYHPAPAPVPYDPLLDWQEIATRFRRLDQVMHAVGLPAEHVDERA